MLALYHFSSDCIKLLLPLVLSTAFLTIEPRVKLIKLFKNNAENKITSTAFSQAPQVLETQITQNDKTNAVAIAVILTVLRRLCGHLPLSSFLCRLIIFICFQQKF
jgi:hypothetical protein